MKFFSSICLMAATVISAPAAASNYQLLSAAISDFQATSTSTFELVNAALSQQTILLNSFALSTAGEVTIFLPSDAGFLNLNLLTLTQNDLYTYLQYHFTQNSIAASPTHVKTFLGDDLLLQFEGGELTAVNSSFGTTSNVLGSSKPLTNIKLYFIDNVARPPVSIDLVAVRYNWSATKLLIAAKANLTLDTVAADNTFLVPSNAAANLFMAKNVAVKWTAAIVSDIVNFQHIDIARIFEGEFKNGGNVTTAEGAVLSFVVHGDDVILVGPVNNVTITSFNYLVEHGVAHTIDGVLLPYALA